MNPYVFKLSLIVYVLKDVEDPLRYSIVDKLARMNAPLRDVGMYCEEEVQKLHE